MPLLQKLPKHCPRGLTLPLCLLFARHLRFDSADPDWADRDRLVLAPALAPMAEALADLAGLPPGWCESYGLPLGAGLGMVLAERLLAARFGRSLVDHRAWVFATGARSRHRPDTRGGHARRAMAAWPTDLDRVRIRAASTRIGRVYRLRLVGAAGSMERRQATWRRRSPLLCGHKNPP